MFAGPIPEALHARLAPSAKRHRPGLKNEAIVGLELALAPPLDIDTVPRGGAGLERGRRSGAVNGASK
jgi:hypothetical protein